MGSIASFAFAKAKVAIATGGWLKPVARRSVNENAGIKAKVKLKTNNRHNKARVAKAIDWNKSLVRT